MSFLRLAPRLSAAAAASLAREIYGLDAEAHPLTSERDQNFLLETDRGRFVLKIANASEDRATLEAQNAAMSHLALHTAMSPRPLPALDGNVIVPTADSHLVRLLTWIPGVPMGTVRRHSMDLLEELGGAVGRIDEALERFDHPAIHREFHWDLAHALRAIGRRLSLVTDPALRALVGATVARIERDDAAARFSRLRRTAIHGDLNDHNVIVGGGTDRYTRNQHVAGIIDFGDMVHSFTVADLAIAAAYAVLDKPDPLAAAAALVAGYHTARPLREDELACVFGLIELRLCLSICMAADQQPQRPDDPVLAISQPPIARTLPRLAALHPRFVEATLRAACGLDPVPRGRRVVEWLRAAPVSDVVRLRTDRTVSAAPVVLDLAVGSPLVSGNPRDNEETVMTPRIEAVMRHAGAAIAIGRYGEPRILYSSPLFAVPGDRTARRTVHLGMDLFTPAGTVIHAPLDGAVHACVENAAPLDYGPVVILRHATDGGDHFFTLYGHLSRESLGSLRDGQVVRAGEPFAMVGRADVNGGWTPHLHFQLIIDLLEEGTDFPGVCAAAERVAWSALSPDPNVILRIPESLFFPVAPDVTQTLAERNVRVGPNVRVGFRHPLKAARGWLQYMYDDAGRRYLDAYNNVPHVGHSHPRVAAAVADQMRVLNTNTRYLHDTLSAFAARLTATLPEPLRVCYFVNSGSEANELALRLAGAHTGRRGTIVLDGGYHGNTTTLIEISPYKFNGPGGRGAPAWVHVVPQPDVYRGPYKSHDPRAGERYAEFVASTIAAMRDHGDAPAVFIAETCPSAGGQIVPPPGYLSAVYSHVRAAGGVCIADEVQTGYGRMGSSFYAFQDQHVVPDIVVLGKPIGNGYPLGAVITTPEIAASFDNGMEFFSTFGGSTVACAAGMAVLDTVLEEKLMGHAASTGALLIEGLRGVGARHSVIGDVRGAGFFLGVELITDRELTTCSRSALQCASTRKTSSSSCLRWTGCSASSNEV
ncbi:MAG: aminotransferase class III-fold pyridoxal phosphate-dependent enzyme [Acidobacteria bacterium]|nr:aminotransferase class III-fold pyridoxal phosphate-dependent enzyme [Acidobacteriota bacterium]